MYGTRNGRTMGAAIEREPEPELELDPALGLELEDELPAGLRVLDGLTESESKAVWFTNSGETGKYGQLGYGKLTGDFDGMGISFGVLQWNIGAGSLQPMIKRFLQREPDRFQAVFGDGAAQMTKVVSSPTKVGLAWAKSIDAGGKTIQEPWRSRFGKLAKEPGFQRIEHEEIKDRLQYAYGYMREFGTRSERSLVFFYDAVVAHGPWWAGKKNRRKLIQARLRPGMTETEKLVAIADVIADTAAPKWKERVRARRRLLATGKGMFHKAFVDLEKQFGISERPISIPAAAQVTGAPAASSGSAGAGSGSGPFAAVSAGSAALAGWLGTAAEWMLLSLQFASGNRDENDLTNRIFYGRHPDRVGTKIKAGETALAQEWISIRDTMVRPALAKVGSGAVAPTPSSPISPAPPGSIPVAPPRPGSGLKPLAAPAGAVLSALAVSTGKLRSASKRKGKVKSVVVHTTGYSTAMDNLVKAGKSPLPRVLNFYISGDEGFPHYVIDYDGTLWATSDERVEAWHAGWTNKGGRSAFTGASYVAPAWWKAAWGPFGFKSPADLVPTGTPNTNSIGVELLAARDHHFTEAQYQTLARLIKDVSQRHGFAPSPIPGPQVHGHEDVNTFTGDGGRADAKGGWDPGAHRAGPRFDWARVDRYVRAL